MPNNSETKKRGPCIADIATLIRAGIDPKTGAPLKMISSSASQFSEGAKKIMRIIDEQDAVNRYKWYNLPAGLTSQELERLLYLRGQLVFFKYEGKFYFMPFALDGTLDFYQRYNSVHPVPLNDGKDKDEGKKKAYQALVDLLSTIKLDVYYSVVEDPTKIDVNKAGVILHDYTKQISQEILPRSILNEPLISYEADLLPLSRTALINSTGVRGVRVQDADSAGELKEVSNSVASAALKGELYIPVIAKLQAQELAGGNSGKVQDYFLALQSVDNLRLSTYGIENGGLFEKKAHVLESEQAMNEKSGAAPLQDGLAIRRHFCNVINSIFKIGAWVDISGIESGVGSIVADVEERVEGRAGENASQEGAKDE